MVVGAGAIERRGLRYTGTSLLVPILTTKPPPKTHH
jgi:hypothetical protein